MRFDRKYVSYIPLAIFLIGLAIFAYLGIYFRYWADDWCYNADFRNLGFLETLRGYLYNVTYTPSRYSVTILAGLFYPLGVFGLQLLIPISLLLWTWGLVRLFLNLSSLSAYPLSTFHATLLSLVIAYFSIYLAPHLYQSIYWNTGFFTYTFPLILFPWVLTLVTDQNPSKPKLIRIALLSLLAGGFSEASNTVLVSMLALYTVIAFVGSRYKKVWAQKTFAPALVALIFAIIAMALLVFAPTTQLRAERYGEPASLSELIVLLFNFTREFVTLSLKDYQQIIIVVLAGLLGFVLNSKEREINVFKIFGLGLGIFALAALLVAAALAPSAYVEHGTPILRTQIIPRHIMVFAFVTLGWLGGYALRQLYSPNWLQPTATVALLVALAFPIFTIFTASKYIPIYSQRANLWDEREATILSAIENGQDRVEVLAIDGAPVGGIRDFDPLGKKGYWITLCAADYHHIKLRVILP
ncbi:MAG: hypothetical protein OZ914_02590 [Anaerolineaceae bacterium]|jgi:hypothetical protein|nr:hypothetical protein [Anaerolineaceae bacterium]OQY89529.1 MAG: hypothetical protein B6D38_06405 [Anaerolineae bacterium UTCFX1]